MAILVVVATMMVMTVVVTEITYAAQVRFLVAHHQRDRVQAYWVARSGYNLYRLILAANKDLEKSGMMDMLPEEYQALMGDALWKMIPALNTGLFRMLLSSGGDIDDVEEDLKTEFQQTGRVELEEGEVEYSRFSDKNFLEFDGDFSAEVSDHETKINVNLMKNDSGAIQDSEEGQQLYALMSGEENDLWFRERNLDRWEVIGNLKDWVDADNTRSAGLGGYEDTLYNKLDDPYLTKNAPFDTKEEIRLVEGWQDELFERFGDDITVYGSGKLNLSDLSEQMLGAVIRAGAETAPRDNELETCVDQVQLYMSVSVVEKYEDFKEIVVNNCGGLVMSDQKTFSFTTSSKTFTITSTGMAGTSSVTLTAVVDYTKRGAGRLKYWRVD